jgi:acetoin utilization protein AcuB
MTKTVITVNDTSEIEEAAYLLYTNKIGALPVVDIDNKLCGIVTDSDIFKALSTSWVLPRLPRKLPLTPAIR